MTDLKSNKKRKGHPQIINPVDEFCLPVSLPTDPEWVAAFIGAIRKLSNRSTWDYDTDGDYIVLADRWGEIADEISLAYQAGITCEAEICEDGSCTEIGPFHPALTYFPNNPITQPDYDGPYQAPIWGTGAGYIGASGTDAMIDVFAYGTANLIDLLTGAILPSITLDFSGSGEIDVQFIATIQGGAVWGYPDGNPLLGDLVSLEYTDIFSLAGTATLVEFFELVVQTDAEAFSLTHSWKFATEGPHTLTLLFFPTAELEPPFIGAGGGLRSVQLCGGAVVDSGEVEPVDIIIDGGKLRATVDDVPVGVGVDLDDIADLIDRWVDEAGDTMTGKLRHSVDGVSDDWTYDNTRIANLQSYADNWLFSTIGAVGMDFRAGRNLSTAPSRIAMSTENIYLFTRQSSEIPPVGDLRVSSYNGIAFRVNDGVSDLSRWYDSLGMLRWAADHSGQILAAGYNGWGYTSTEALQQQFKLSGDWQDDTEASRIGSVALSLDGHLGTQEIMRGMWNEAGDNPTLKFFGGDGYGFRPALIDYSNTGQLSELLAEVLKQYHLIEDYDVAGAPPEASGLNLTDYEKCSAAYYVAALIAATIADLFSNLYTVTYQEQVSGIIDGYGIQASIAIQMLAALEQTYTSLTDINSDLSDPSVIADMLLAAEFDKTAFYELIEAYAWIEPLSVDLLEVVLDGLWPNMGSYIAIGSQTDQGACAAEFGCGDVDINFRDGLSHGAVGVGVPTLGEGLHAGFIDPNYRSQVTLIFEESCSFSGGSITLDTAGSNGWQIHGYVNDGMGGYTDIYTQLRAATSGAETLSISNMNDGAFDRLDIWIASQSSYYPGTIKELHLTSTG